MSIPGFTAEASSYRSNNNYKSSSIGISARGTTVEVALMRQGLGLTCSGSCPAGQLLCQCDKACGCCIGGCRCTVDGDVLCDRNPAAGGGSSGFPIFSTGSAGGVMA
jgi:hypothetical protein